jgi:hypothetical protein
MTRTDDMYVEPVTFIISYYYHHYCIAPHCPEQVCVPNTYYQLT